MNLSMHIIEDWMSDRVISSKIDRGDCLIASCLLSDLDEGCAPDCLYIGKAALHAEYADGVNTVICRNAEDIVVIQSDDEIDVYQQIMNAFIFYNHWEGELKDAVIMRSSFQRVVEIAYRAFRCVILAFDWRGVILGSMPEKTDDTEVSIIEPYIFKRMQEGEVCKRVAQNTIPAGFVDTHVYPSVLAFNVVFSDNSFIIVYCVSDAPRKNGAHMQLALYMRSVISYLKPDYSSGGHLEPLHGELIQILDGEKPNHAKIEEIQRFKDWQHNHKYMLYVFEAHSDFQLKRKGADWMLADRINHSIVFSYQDRPLMLLPLSERASAGEILPTILPYLDISGGGSMPFSDWEALPTAYMQAKAAMALGGNEPGKFYCCEDYASDYIMLCVHEQCKKINMISPDAELLKAYDEENKSELLKTLNVYLRCQSSMTASAEQLYIHLNSMKYRMKKIESMISSDLKKHNDRITLLFSSDILLDQR